MYNDPAPNADPYSDAYSVPAPAPPVAASDDRDRPARGRSGTRSPQRSNGGEFARSPAPRRRSPVAPRKPTHAPVAPNPSSVLGVFGLSIRTQERDLDEEFSKFGRVVKVTIVYDQRSDRSRGFGFIEMATVEDASRCIENLNGVDLNGRRIRVDFSITDRPHAPTPGEYMGHRRGGGERQREPYHRDSYRDSYRDRDHGRRGGGGGGYDRDSYGRETKDRGDWRDRRSPAPRRPHSPEYRRRRSYSRSPPPRAAVGSPRGRDYDAPSSGANARW